MMLASTLVLYSACSGVGTTDKAPDEILKGSSGLSSVLGELTPVVGMGGLRKWHCALHPESQNQ